MGCLQSAALLPDDENAKKQSELIDQGLKGEKVQIENLYTLLLLGAGDAGKSTIMKQMKIIHKDGFSSEERLVYRSIIFDNLVLIGKSLLQGCIKLNLELMDANKALAQEIINFDKDEDIYDPIHILSIIHQLWQDPALRTAFVKNNQFQLIDSAPYYLNSLDKIMVKDYIPTESDVLHTRVTTVGIVETEFEYEKLRFRMVDVGGQRSERKKWIHCFQNVTSIIFCVSLAEYDLSMYEDEKQNRMLESLSLFEQIINCRWFYETPIILFLNKMDLFEEKIRKIDLKLCFPDYEGGPNKETALQFITSKFIFQNKNENRKIYIYNTTATNTENIKYVFAAVKDNILANNIRM